MLDNIDAVIFDLDGSLVDSMWMWKQIDLEYLDRFGIPLPENLQSELEGMSFEAIAEILDMQPAAVRVALSRARKLIRDVYRATQSH